MRHLSTTVTDDSLKPFRAESKPKLLVNTANCCHMFFTHKTGPLIMLVGESERMLQSCLEKMSGMKNRDTNNNPFTSKSLLELEREIAKVTSSVVDGQFEYQICILGCSDILFPIKLYCLLNLNSLQFRRFKITVVDKESKICIEGTKLVADFNLKYIEYKNENIHYLSNKSFMKFDMVVLNISGNCSTIIAIKMLTLFHEDKLVIYIFVVLLCI